MENNIKKYFKLLRSFLFIFIVGSGGALLMNYYILPTLSEYPAFSKSKLLRKFKENVTIINKTEEVVIKEDSVVSKIASQASNATVDIVSFQKKDLKTTGNASEKNMLGAGTVITSDGLVVTYREAIIENQAEYKILTVNGSEFVANLVGIDEFTNLAFLKIEASNLSTMNFVNSDDVVAGKRIVAVAKSLSSYRNRYATGIIGNINETFNISGEALSNSKKMEGVFEPDFVLLSEFVGAPAIDYNGDMVGIIGKVMLNNNEKYFIIPSNLVRESMELVLNQQVEGRVNFGAYYVSITRPIAITRNLPRNSGALIYSASGKQGLAIIKNSPAERAGLLIGDIVSHVNEKEVTLNSPLSNILSHYKAGDEITLTILRDGKDLQLKAVL